VTLGPAVAIPMAHMNAHLVLSDTEATLASNVRGLINALRTTVAALVSVAAILTLTRIAVALVNLAMSSMLDESVLTSMSVLITMVAVTL